jgi:GntR family transcriptional regulator of vanillate catabolism
VEEQDGSRSAPRSLSVAERVRDAILSGEYEAGERINEVHLSRALGVSRTPTRAALHALAAEGLVDYTHNRGFSVRAFPLQAVLDAYEIRASLEGLAARLAAERGLTEEGRAAIVDALAEGDAILRHQELNDEDLARYRIVNVTFHDAVLTSARSRMLSESVRLTLNMPGSTHRNIVAFKHQDVRRRHDDHHRIFEAIEAGDGWRAEVLMREHVSSIKATLLARLQHGPPLSTNKLKA